MPLLSELQKDFLQAVLHRVPNKIGDHIIPGKIGVQRRLEIYSNNVQSNLISALEAVYPVIQNLVGVDFFKQVAREYLVRYPSSSGDIHGFGVQFPQFLSWFRGLERLTYLSDTARLEWAIHEAFHSADSTSLPLEKLATVAPEDYSRLKFILHPACRLLTSIYPIKRIWEINQPDYEKEDSVHLDEGGVYLLLCRPEFMVELMDLSLPEYNLLLSIATGSGFSEGTEQVLKIDQSFKAGPFLQIMVEKNVIVDFELQEAV